MQLGIAFVPSLPPESLVPLARAAEAHGLDELWVWEDCFKQSGLASAAVALASTERITVGIGLLPVALRNPALTAMELATLARQFPGRLIAGLGHGVQDWMRQAGAKVASPMTLLAEQTDAITRLLRGETVSTEGRYVRLDGVRLEWPPADPPAIMLGGVGPKSLALAASVGAGALLTGSMSHAETTESVAQIRAASNGADGSAGPIVTSVIVAIGPDGERRAAVEVAAWDKEPAPGRATSGSAAEIAAAFREVAALGPTSVVAQPTADETDVLELVRFLGTEVRPLLAGEPV